MNAQQEPQSMQIALNKDKCLETLKYFRRLFIRHLVHNQLELERLNYLRATIWSHIDAIGLNLMQYRCYNSYVSDLDGYHSPYDAIIEGLLELYEYDLVLLKHNIPYLLQHLGKKQCILHVACGLGFEEIGFANLIDDIAAQNDCPPEKMAAIDISRFPQALPNIRGLYDECARELSRYEDDSRTARPGTIIGRSPSVVGLLRHCLSLVELMPHLREHNICRYLQWAGYVMQAIDMSFKGIAPDSVRSKFAF